MDLLLMFIILINIDIVQLVINSENSIIVQRKNEKLSAMLETNEILDRDVCSEGVSDSSCEQCGLSNRNKIVGGRSAAANEHPWMVALVYEDVVICGGSLINDRYVLTAAHCVVSLKGKKRKKLRLVAKLHDKRNKEGAILRKAARIIMHPAYNVYTSENDIALLKLNKRVKFQNGVHPVCLPCPTVNVTAGENVTIIGWGAVQESGETADFLQKATIPIVEYSECYQVLSNYAFITMTPSMLCAGLSHGGQDSCQGDSGGPLLWNKNGVWIQVGLVSWGEGCARANSYGVYTRISAFIHWIDQVAKDSYC